MAKLNVGELIINTLAPTLGVVATNKLVDLFEKMWDKDNEKATAALKAMYIGVVQLQNLTDDTKTKIDDALVDAIRNAIEQSAAEHGITLDPGTV